MWSDGLSKDNRPVTLATYLRQPYPSRGIVIVPGSPKVVRRIELFPLTRIQTTSALHATDAGKTLRHMEQGYIGKEGIVNT